MRTQSSIKFGLLIWIFASAGCITLMDESKTLTFVIDNQSDHRVTLLFYSEWPRDNFTIDLPAKKRHVIKRECLRCGSVRIPFLPDFFHPDSIRIFKDGVYFQTDWACDRDTSATLGVLPGCTTKGTPSILNAIEEFAFDDAYFTR